MCTKIGGLLVLIFGKREKEKVGSGEERTKYGWLRAKMCK